jgi:RimJ/RimL family protein N-acetyltransferase
MMQQRRLPTLATPRLRLRALRAGDVNFLAVLDSDPLVMKYVHHGAMSWEEALRFAQVQLQLAAWRRHFGKWLVVLRHSKVRIGWVELSKLSGPDRDDLQIGYQFAPVHWGQGYATEAVRAVVKYAFYRTRLDRVAAIARPDNAASIRILEKLGFQVVGRRFDEARVWCTEFRLEAPQEAGSVTY